MDQFREPIKFMRARVKELHQAIDRYERIARDLVQMQNVRTLNAGLARAVRQEISEFECAIIVLEEKQNGDKTLLQVPDSL